MKTSHYPALELCKKLTEAGFPETKLSVGEEGIMSTDAFRSIQKRIIPEKLQFYVCPSVMELLDEIPLTITWGDGEDYHLAIEPFYKEVCYRRWYKGYATEIQVIHNMRIPNALAECWLWLKENGYIKTNNS